MNQTHYPVMNSYYCLIFKFKTYIVYLFLKGSRICTIVVDIGYRKGNQQITLQ